MNSEVAIMQESLSSDRQLRYVEDKRLDMARVEQLLALSSRKNQWSNFGPVAELFENTVADHINLAPGLSIVACASATAALHALVSLQETLNGRPRQWVTSAFGFYCTVQGPLQNAVVVDCDKRSMLDLDNVSDCTSDGIIVTNVFGQEADLAAYRNYASIHGKDIIVDAALALDSHSHGPNECISFHHTKPWGFGEGGCAVVASEHEAVFRSLVSFGHEPGGAINKLANNGKMSDVAAAFCLSRLESMCKIAPEYQTQYVRISEIGAALGFEILGGRDAHPGTPSTVPLLLPSAVADVTHDLLPTGRYYHPLAATREATNIYNRIVNVPCHGGLQLLTDVQIKGSLAEILDRI